MKSKALIEKTILCPHCGHPFHLSLDISGGDQNYYEECPNCCRDVHVRLHLDDAHQRIVVGLDGDDEQLY